MPDVVQPALHGRDHCLGGSDPIPCLGGQRVHLFSWNYDTDNTVPDQTWTPVANFASGGGLYEEVAHSDPLKAMAWDYDTGTIALTPPYFYEIGGWMQFNEDTQIDNELRVVAINFGSSLRYIVHYRFDIADGSLSAAHLPAPRVRALISFGGAQYPWMEVWQNSGGDLTIRAAEYYAERLIDNLAFEARP
jgi:hypothetical protein